jgi:DnaK suppressor protein
MSITLPQNYRPTEREPFMNPMQQEYFRQKLLKWKGELIEESNQTLQNMQEESLAQPDLADRATAETDRSLELRTRDRFRKLISKIDQALKSIEEGTYGYCEETGEPISLKRPRPGQSPPSVGRGAPSGWSGRARRGWLSLRSSAHG